MALIGTNGDLKVTDEYTSWRSRRDSKLCLNQESAACYLGSGLTRVTRRYMCFHGYLELLGVSLAVFIVFLRCFIHSKPLSFALRCTSGSRYFDTFVYVLCMEIVNKNVMNFLL